MADKKKKNTNPFSAKARQSRIDSIVAGAVRPKKKKKKKKSK